MRRGGLVVLAALAVTACGPSPSEQADICAIFALPGVPGDTQVGDASDLAWARARERELFKSGAVFAPGWRMSGDTRSGADAQGGPKPSRCC